VKIQDAAKTVVGSVDNLATYSNTMLSFVADDVIRDYKTMLSVTEQYNKDAENINELVIDLSATSEEVLASIQNMIKAINEVAHATNKGAEGISNIAEKSLNIVNKASSVSNSVNSVMNSANNLNEMVLNFEI